MKNDNDDHFISFDYIVIIHNLPLPKNALIQWVVFDKSENKIIYILYLGIYHSF